MKTIGILTLLLPVYVFADIGFHPMGTLGENAVFFNIRTTDNLLTFSLLQILDKSDITPENASFPKYAKESMGGFLGGVLGGLIGAGIPIIALTILGRDFYYDPCYGDIRLMVGFCVGTPPGAILGLTKGVMIAGKKLGENGSYRKTLLGTLIGTGVGLLVGESAWSIIGDHSMVGPIVGVTVGSIISVAGAVWGYNW